MLCVTDALLRRDPKTGHSAFLFIGGAFGRVAWREMCDSLYSGYDELGRTRNNRISQYETR